MSEITLGGYQEIHERAVAFAGSDGHAYTVALYVEDEPDARGRFPGALLFIRWNSSGDAPAGHLETDWLVQGSTPDDARARLGAMTLYEAKDLLESCIAASRPEAL